MTEYLLLLNRHYKAKARRAAKRSIPHRDIESLEVVDLSDEDEESSLDGSEQPIIDGDSEDQEEGTDINGTPTSNDASESSMRM
jgi:hypothetical protein